MSTRNNLGQKLWDKFGMRMPSKQLCKYENAHAQPQPLDTLLKSDSSCIEGR